MENLILKINENLGFFTSRDVRVIVVNGESPFTNKIWIEQRNLEIEVFSDPSLELAKLLVGIRDLNDILFNTKGIRLGAPYFISNPGVVLLNEEGIFKNKMIIQNFEKITNSMTEVARMAGLTGKKIINL